MENQQLSSNKPGNEEEEVGQQSDSITHQSMSNSSRQNHHDDPPPLPSTTTGPSSTGSATTTDERQEQLSTSTATGQVPPREEEKTGSIRVTASTAVEHLDVAPITDGSGCFSLTDSSGSSLSGFASRSCGTRGRSMELRKVPMDTALLFGSSQASRKSTRGEASGASSREDNSDHTHTDDEYDDLEGAGGLCKDDNAQKRRPYSQGSCARRILRSTCLRSNFSLQNQLLLSFGMVSLLTILLVLCICVAVSILSGNKVNDLTRDSLEELSYQMEGKMVRYVAEALSIRLLPHDLVQILHDASVDRLIGYPNHPGYENDTLTPFPDVYTQQRIYPVKGPTASLDWDLQNLVTPETADEHVQRRYHLFEKYAKITTSQTAYSFQGNCNPDATRGDYDWYPHCQPANNDVATGGVVRPVPTNPGLHLRSSDLTPLFKAIFEDTPTLRDVGICFANSGAGSTAIFPGYSLDSTQNYTSAGCDWMRHPNPHKPEQPLGTDEMIARCAPKGTIVNSRDYNPLERGWCREQALHPDKIQMMGPFPDAWNNDVQLMLVGKAVYDPLTKELIGCLFLDFTLENVQKMLENITVTPNSHVSIVRWDEHGDVAASSAWTSDHYPDQDTKIQDLEIGVHAEDYHELYNMVNYTEAWEPQEVRDTYSSRIHHDTEHGYLVAAYPMPPIPEEYDPEYRPQWLVIMSVSTEDVLVQAEGLEQYVDDKVESLVYFSLVAGVVGWVLVMFVILVVSQALTLPLQTMNQATKDIVDNFGGNSEKGIAYNAPTFHPCAPETEVSQVVCEFKKMVQKFSGSSKMAKAVQERFTELANHFSFEQEFEELYKSRQEGSFAYSYNEGTPSVPPTSRARKNPSHRKTGQHLIHFGTILTGNQSHLNLRKTKRRNGRMVSEPAADSKGKRLFSPLFLWIVVFIVTPLLVTTVTMSVIVTVKLSNELTDVIDNGKQEYVILEKFALKAAVGLRAAWIAAKTEQTTRNLALVSRYAGWLLFGGLERRDSFTQLTTGADECKMEDDPMECPYVDDLPCDCFLDQQHETCWDGLAGSGDYASRYLQEAYFVCQSADTTADGDRPEALRFPADSFSPETTAWWHNMTSVPGFEKGSRAEGHDTTYDRARVLSSIPVFQTLYNYKIRGRTTLQSGVAMEADGMVVGYHGCSMVGEAMAAFWESTPGNHANDIRPELCPVGKFGFDPRCREWYDTGKSLSEKDTDLYVASPYWYATDSIVGQTATSPLVDPLTGEYVGQAFVDYRSESIYDLLSPENTVLESGFPILISARADQNGANTIIGPGYQLGVDKPMPIEDVILRNELDCYEPECVRHQEEFEKVMEELRSGQIGAASYTIRKDDGTEEQMFIAYAPVIVPTFPPVNSSDFNRGISVQENTIYYLALTEIEAKLVAAFDQVEEDINLTIDVGIAILSMAIVLATIVVIYISYWVAISITQPMLYLLELISQINEVDDDDEILVDIDMQSGSREVKSVAHTMGTLHKIVHCANSAYFAGDIDKAYAVLTDSARLFKRLDNKKAVGVANNNLGNTMLAMYRAMKANPGANPEAERFCGLTRGEIVLKGLSYFHQAITLGEKAYDEFYEAEGWSPNCLDFMQHLANRYFNRAMFLLTVKDDHDNPKELEELGMRDLQIARDMDVEIVDQGTEVGWQVNTADKLFKVSLNRARGHLLLLEMGYPDDWDLEELLEELFRSLNKELKSKVQTSDLFHELGPAGRMQQVDTELMRYKELKGDLDTASKIAIRMLVEDEFILPEAQLKAVHVLLTVLRQSESQAHVQGQLELFQTWLRRAKAACDNNLASAETPATEDVSEVISMSIAKLNMNVSMMEDTSVRLPKHSSLLATTRGDVTMEIF